MVSSKWKCTREWNVWVISACGAARTHEVAPSSHDDVDGERRMAKFISNFERRTIATARIIWTKLTILLFICCVRCVCVCILAQTSGCAVCKQCMRCNRVHNFSPSPSFLYFEIHFIHTFAGDKQMRKTGNDENDLAHQMAHLSQLAQRERFRNFVFGRLRLYRHQAYAPRMKYDECAEREQKRHSTPM